MALHNCQNIAAWFSPLSIIQAALATSAVAQYIGRETRNGIPVDHIRFSRQLANFRSASEAAIFSQLSQTDIYLDANTHVPLAIAWKAHFDNDYRSDVPVEIRFAGYGANQGVSVPARIQRLVAGSLNLDLRINSVQLNTGINDSEFAVQ